MSPDHRENQLKDARRNTMQLVAEMIRGAQSHSFHVLTEFFLNEALFHLRPLFPFTD
jgi:hypothetical protein